MKSSIITLHAHLFDDAIKKGFNPTVPHTFEIDLMDLSEEQRGLLAGQIGFFKAPHSRSTSFLLRSPDLEGIQVYLQGILDRQSAQEAAAEKTRLEQIAKAEEDFKARKFAKFRSEVRGSICPDTLEVLPASSGNSVDFHKGYEILGVDSSYYASTYAHRFQELLDNEEGPISTKDWLEAHNEESRLAAVEALNEQMEARIETLRECNENEANLRHWVTTLGSDLLRARMEEDCEWRDLAETEIAESIRQRFFPEFTFVKVDDDFELDYARTTELEPSLDQLNNLRRFRSLTDNMAASYKPVVALLLARYEREDEDGDVCEVMQCYEIEFTFTFLGMRIVRRFKA